MLALITLLLLQRQTSAQPTPSVHELVRDIPRFADPVRTKADAQLDDLDRKALNAEAGLRRLIEAGSVLELEDWRVLLIEKGYLRRRERWPVSVAFVLDVELPPIQDGLELEIRSDLPGFAPVRTCEFTGNRPTPTRRSTAFLALEQRTVRLELWPRYAPGSRAAMLSPRTRSLGWITVAVLPVARTEDAIEATTDPELVAAVRSGVHLDLSRGTPLLELRHLEWPAEVVSTFEIQLVHAGVAETTTEWDRIGRIPRLTPGRSATLRGLSVEQRADLESCANWTLRIRGTPRDVLRDWNATRYWAGELEIPLRELIQH